MIIKKYDENNQRKFIMLIYLSVAILICGVIFSSIGMKGSWYQLFEAIWQYATGTLAIAENKEENAIILIMRIPRICMAIIVGMILSIAGGVMQSVTRNYLVSPFTIGISSASTFGAAIAIILGSNNIWILILCAFLMSMACTILVFGITKKIGITPVSIILIGIALNYLFSAGTESIRYFAKGYQLEALVQWSFGSLSRANWDGVFVTAIIGTICIFIVHGYHLSLDVISSNTDEVSKTLGVDAEKIRLITGCLSVLMTSTVICFTGVIGFVGLIAPHISRILIGDKNLYSIPFAGGVGALLMLVADAIGHFAFPPNDIPVGVVLSFVGVPLFIHLVLKARK